MVWELLHRHLEVRSPERRNIAAEPGDRPTDDLTLLIETFHEKLNARDGCAILALEPAAHDRFAVPMLRLPIDLEVPFPAGNRAIAVPPTHPPMRESTAVSLILQKGGGEKPKRGR